VSGPSPLKNSFLSTTCAPLVVFTICVTRTSAATLRKQYASLLSRSGHSSLYGRKWDLENAWESE
jgi:hypothetical protein